MSSFESKSRASGGKLVMIELSLHHPWFLGAVGELGNEAGVSLCSLGWPELTEMR